MDGKSIVTRHCVSTIKELKAFIKNDESTGLELMIASTLLKGIKLADVNILNWFYSRLGWDFDEDGYRKKILIDAEVAKAATGKVDTLSFK